MAKQITFRYGLSPEQWVGICARVYRFDQRGSGNDAQKRWLEIAKMMFSSDVRQPINIKRKVAA